jgi:hypothetical protein
MIAKRCELRVHLIDFPTVKRLQEDGSCVDARADEKSLYYADAVLYWLIINHVKHDFGDVTNFERSLRKEQIEAWFYDDGRVKSVKDNIYQILRQVKFMLGQQKDGAIVLEQPMDGTYRLSERHLVITGDIVDLLHLLHIPDTTPYDDVIHRQVEAVLSNIGRNLLEGFDVHLRHADGYLTWLDRERMYWRDRIIQLASPYVIYLAQRGQTHAAASELRRHILGENEEHRPYETVFLMLLMYVNNKPLGTFWNEYQQVHREFVGQDVGPNDPVRRTYLALSTGRVSLRDLPVRLHLAISQVGGLTLGTQFRAEWLNPLLSDIGSVQPVLAPISRTIWKEARAAAGKAGYTYFGELFVLQALLKHADKRLLEFLERKGVLLDQLHQQITQLIDLEATSGTPVDSPRPTSAADQLLLENHSSTIAPIDLFIALLRRPGRVAERLLWRYGITASDVEVLREQQERQ